ncbi:hypothetical protein MMC13_006569 [Lambiella insularis]|nr:hypothetical protein [Lambiella insularis]
MAHPSHLLTEELQQVLKTHTVELTYERCLFQSSLLCEEEKARRLRLNLLLLEDANDDLQEQLSVEDHRNSDMEGMIQDIRGQLDAVEGESERLRGELRIKNREVENLKAELNSLQGVSMDSTKLLTEKLALSRELAVLRPELEHLRSQATSYQNVLAEKLSLQRQLSNTQVELETEKRATQRALSREEGKQEHDAKLEAQFDDLQAELAKARRERQKAERDTQSITTEFDSKRTILESRLDAFRNKLRMTKEQLKETQEELQTARAAARAQSSATAGSNVARETARNPRKRSLAQLDVDTAIGTPGVVPVAKKNKRSSTLPGDKSTFSITPFLNRTASVAPESPVEDGDNIENEEQIVPGKNERVDVAEATGESPSGPPVITRMKKGTQKAAVPKKPAAPALAKTTKLNPKGAASRKTRTLPSLEQVQEEGNDENEPPADHHPTLPKDAGTQASIKMGEASDRASEEPTFIKKKRKVLGGGLGKTLFDDDDGDVNRGGDRGLFGGAKGFGALGRPLGSVKLGGRAPASSGFGAFSPLKKDRKTVAA